MQVPSVSADVLCSYSYSLSRSLVWLAGRCLYEMGRNYCGLFQRHSSPPLSILIWLLQWSIEFQRVTLAGETGLESERSSRLFPLFAVIRMTNQRCVPDAADSIGMCFTNKQCRSAGGVASGPCAKGFGVCCVFTATCGSVVTQNYTNIRTRTYPETFAPTGYEVCNVRLQKPHSNVCQVRLDFIQLQLAPAEPLHGHCMTDMMVISGATGTALPNLCGDLSGHHMYFDYGSSDRITLTLTTDGGAFPSSRDWNIRTTFIECTSVLRAPDGCLQYHTTAVGQVRMLGYPMAAHFANLDYTVCVRSEDGVGAIVWSLCEGEPVSRAFATLGTPNADGTAGVPGATCLVDYIVIMSDTNPSDPTMPAVSDRYCGTAFATPTAPHVVRSEAKPFILRVRTDFTEGADPMNTGFCLAFRQEPSRSQTG